MRWARLHTCILRVVAPAWAGSASATCRFPPKFWPDSFHLWLQPRGRWFDFWPGYPRPWLRIPAASLLHNCNQSDEEWTQGIDWNQKWRQIYASANANKIRASTPTLAMKKIAKTTCCVKIILYTHAAGYIQYYVKRSPLSICYLLSLWFHANFGLTTHHKACPTHLACPRQLPRQKAHVAHSHICRGGGRQ